jgi:hypothetical protein
MVGRTICNCGLVKDYFHVCCGKNLAHLASFSVMTIGLDLRRAIGAEEGRTF